MEVDSKTLRFQTSLGSESGEELCHFSSGIWSILVPMAWWLLKPSSGVEGPSQIQKASGDYRECGRQPTFSTPQRRLCKPDGRKLRDRRYAGKDGNNCRLFKSNFLSFMNIEMAAFTKSQKDLSVLDHMMQKWDLNCENKSLKKNSKYKEKNNRHGFALSLCTKSLVTYMALLVHGQMLNAGKNGQSSCTTPVVTAGGVEGGGDPILCVKIIRGQSTTRMACEAPGVSLKPTVAPWRSGPCESSGCHGVQGAQLGEHSRGQQQSHQACCLQLSIHPKPWGITNVNVKTVGRCSRGNWRVNALPKDIHIQNILKHSIGQCIVDSFCSISAGQGTLLNLLSPSPTLDRESKLAPMEQEGRKPSFSNRSKELQVHASLRLGHRASYGYTVACESSSELRLLALFLRPFHVNSLANVKKEKEPEKEAGYQGNGILPKRVQKRAPSTGSGSEAKRALNFPIMPNASMSAAPYCITRRLPTCGTHRGQRKAFTSRPSSSTHNYSGPAGKCDKTHRQNLDYS
eukprot:bmy_16010T0